jgi:type II restriction enzyme
MNSNLTQLIRQYKEDKQSVYNTWFINRKAVKGIYSIRRTEFSKLFLK